MATAERILVTGATGGIGAAVCAELAARGLTPIVGYHRHADRASAMAAALGSDAVALDMTRPEQISSACEQLAAHADSVAGVVLAASPPPILAPFGTITADDMVHQWQVNVLGPQQLLAGLVRHCFRPQKRGSVLGVLTTAMGEGIGTAAPNMGAYVIAKYGLAGLLAAVAADYPWLRVHRYSPGFTETPMLEAFDPRYLEQQRRHHRFETPEQVAAKIVSLLLTP